MPAFFAKQKKPKVPVYVIDRHSLKALALSIRAGISPREALLYIAASKKGKHKKDIEMIADMFSAGIAYSDVFLRTQLSRSPLFIQIIRISESSGQIATALEKIVGHISNASKAKSQVIGLSVYPLIVLVMTLAFMLFALLVIVPNIEDIIRMPGVMLNPLTCILLFSSDLLIHKSWMVLTAIAAVSASCILVFRLKFIRAYLESFVLKSPLISSFMESYIFGSYAAFIALYVRFRSDIGTVFTMLSESSRMGLIRSEFIRVSESVSAGMQLSDALATPAPDGSGKGVVPRIWILFASVAERSSSYAEMFDHLSQYHSENLDHYSKVYMKLLEPVLMVGIGVMVGLLAYGILSPLYGLMQHIK